MPPEGAGLGEDFFFEDFLAAFFVFFIAFLADFFAPLLAFLPAFLAAFFLAMDHCSSIKRRPTSVLPAPADGRPALVGVPPRREPLPSLPSRFGVRRAATARFIAPGDTHLSSMNDASCIAKMLTRPSKMATSFHALGEVLLSNAARRALMQQSNARRIVARTKNSVTVNHLSPIERSAATERSFPQRGALRRPSRADSTWSTRLLCVLDAAVRAHRALSRRSFRAAARTFAPPRCPLLTD